MTKRNPLDEVKICTQKELSWQTCGRGGLDAQPISSFPGISCISMITIRVNSKPLEAALADAKRQIPFATATALNDIAFGVMRGENAAMAKVFTHPRPFTQRATQEQTKAKKTHLAAVVSIRPTQLKYLAPYETGGLHNLPGSGLLEPVNARLDQYGQLPKGAVARMAQMPNVFVGKVHGITGFWQRVRGHHLKLLLRFAENKPVTKRLNFQIRAKQIADALAPAAMQKAVAKAMATMK